MYYEDLWRRDGIYIWFTISCFCKKIAHIYYALLLWSVVLEVWLHWLVFSSPLLMHFLPYSLPGFLPREADMDQLDHWLPSLWLPGGSDPQESPAKIRGWGETLIASSPALCPTQGSGNVYILCSPSSIPPAPRLVSLCPVEGAFCFPEGAGLSHNIQLTTTERIRE